MKTTKLLSITSLLLIAAMLLAPAITAQVPGGIATGIGSTSGGTATGLGSTHGGIATGLGSILGGIANFLGAINGGLAQVITGATTETTPTETPATPETPQTPETPTTNPTETPGPIEPTPIPPGIPVPPGGFPTNADAKWQNLPDVTIKQGSPDGTIIQANVFSKCTDADDEQLTFSIKTKSDNFDLSYIGNNLEIFNLKSEFTGTEQITLTCNKVPENFFLTVTATQTPVNEEDKISVHISTIRLPDESTAGELMPVTITFRNEGNERLDNMKIAVIIPELGIRASAGPIDLSKGKRISKTIYAELPENTEPGTYYARIMIDGSSVHRVKHRELTIA